MSQEKPTPTPACLHCGAPVPAGEPGALFCCGGCKGAHQLLTGAGLGRYYALRDAAGVAVGPAAEPRGAGPSLAWLEALLEEAPPCDGVRRLQLDVQGIQCGACVWLIEQLFRRQPGGLGVEVNPGLGRMSLIFEEERFPLRAWLTDLARLGYTTGPARKGVETGDDLLLRFGVCAAIAMNGMIFSAAGYFGMTAETDATLWSLFGWLNLGLSTLSLAVGGSVFIRGAIGAAMRRMLHLDVPIALGLLVAWAGSAWSFLAATGEAAYFDTLQIFIALMLLGRMIQRRVVARNRAMLLEDDGVGGLVVRRLEADGAVRGIQAARITEGDRLIIAPGEVAPVAATLEGGDAELALDWLNGEPEPRRFTQGETIPAGARSCGARPLTVVAGQGFADSRLKALLAAARVEGDRPLWGRFWDQVSRVYVAAVLGVAGLGALIWWPQGPERTLEVIVAVLVVTCPCALGLATPLAYDIIQSRLRGRGMFIRRMSFLDRALAIRKVLFDKTGTLTLGELALADPHAPRALPEDAQAALSHMVARSNHPRSRALFRALEESTFQRRPDPLAPVEEVAGQGLSLGWEGAMWRLGSPTFACPGDPASQGSNRPAELRGPADGTFLSRDGVEIARFHFNEALRADARAEVDALHALGMEVYLLSGDQPERVCDIAQHLGISAQRARAAASPEEKAAFIRSIDEADTLMIGDGINDAPAFNAAFCAGTPAVDRPTLPGRSDFFYLGNGVGPIAETLSLARRVRVQIHRNLALAATYNVLTISLALAGLMSPLLCAIAMPISSIGIVLATTRALRRDASAEHGASLGAPGPTLSRALEGVS